MSRLSIRLGDLSDPLSLYCEVHELTESEAARIAIAKLLKVEAPLLEAGNPDWIATRNESAQREVERAHRRKIRTKR